MPGERALRHVPILLIDAVGFTRLAGVEERRAALRVLQEVLTQKARFFMPYGEVWEKWIRHGTGDGYYFVFDALPVHVALRYALGIGEALAERTSSDLTLRVRMVLAVGDVEWVGDQILSDAFAVAERLISHPPFKRFGDSRAEPWALALTRLFHHGIETQPAEGFEGLDGLGWTPFTAVDKHGAEHPAYVLGPGLDETAAAPAEPKRPRITILIGHSLDDPLPEAVELAHRAVRDLAATGRAVEIRIDQATTAALARELQRGCDLLIYYGHGSSDGHLMFADGRRSFAQLNETLADLWKGVGACFVFACHGERFAEALPCPWLAFTEPILRLSPRPFLVAVAEALRGGEPLNRAVETARGRFAALQAERSGFLDALCLSEAPLPALTFGQGEPNLTRLTAGLAGRARVDFAPPGEYGYPDHDPFVGRSSMLKSLLEVPSPELERPLQRVVWIHGAPGMGKSAILRQLAMTARDLLFHDPGNPIWVLHLHTHKHSRPDTLLADLGERVKELYDLPTSLADADGLARALGDRPGRHLWVLDDLTYLDTRPDSTAARDIVASLKAAATAYAVPLQLVVSSRRPPPPGVEGEEIGPLDFSEARLLAAMVCRQAGFDPKDKLDLELGAARLFHLVRGLTVHYKRSLTLAVEREISFSAYAESLEAQGSLEDLEAADLALAMARHELHQLDELELRHGFAYARFLGNYFPIIERAGWFTAGELAAWFGDAFQVGPPQFTETIYRSGLETLSRLGFCLRETRATGVTYLLPPNQRQVVKALSNPGGVAPVEEVPLRGVQERLSLALEGAARGNWHAASDLLEMEQSFGEDLPNPAAAAAVFAAKRLRAELEVLGHSDSHRQIRVAEEILGLYDLHCGAYETGSREETTAAEQVATALVNKGVTLGQLQRSEEEILVYDDIVRRFAERPETSLAEQVARALVYKGLTLGQLQRSEEAILVYDDIVRRFAERPETSLAEQVAKALFNKGVRLGQLQRSEEAILVYDDVVRRFAERPETSLAEQVAKALVNKGVTLGQTQRFEEAILVFDDVVRRFAERPETSLAEQVATALVNKGVTLGQLQRSEEEILVYDDIVRRFAERPETSLAEQVARALFNKGVSLGQLQRSEEAILVYDDIVRRFAERPETSLAEQVANALFNKGVRLGQLQRSEEEILVYDDIVRRFAERPETSLAEQVAKALVNKGVSLGQTQRSEEEILVYDDVVRRFAERPETSLAEQVAKALVYKGVTLGQLQRSEEEILVYDDIVRRFAERPETSLAELVAKVLVNKGVRLGQLQRSEEAILVYDDVVRRFAERPETSLAELVTKALVNKGLRLGRLQRSEEAILVFDDVVRRFAERPETSLAEQVAKALRSKALMLSESERWHAALAAWEDLVGFLSARGPDLDHFVAPALEGKASALNALKRPDPGGIEEQLDSLPSGDP